MTKRSPQRHYRLLALAGLVVAAVAGFTVWKIGVMNRTGKRVSDLHRANFR